MESEATQQHCDDCNNEQRSLYAADKSHKAFSNPRPEGFVVRLFDWVRCGVNPHLPCTGTADQDWSNQRTGWTSDFHSSRIVTAARAAVSNRRFLFKQEQASMCVRPVRFRFSGERTGLNPVHHQFALKKEPPSIFFFEGVKVSDGGHHHASLSFGNGNMMGQAIRFSRPHIALN
jgi:hypothetical protein